MLTTAMKQKSSTQLLAKRKKFLEHRLLATREVLKLQNEHIKEEMGSSVGSKPLSFSEATKRIARINNSKRQQAQHFHSVVDKYLSHMREQSQLDQWGVNPSMATPTKLVGMLTSQAMSSPGSVGSDGGSSGRKTSYGHFSLQPPRQIKQNYGTGGQSKLTMSLNRMGHS